jgi:hypothetical protein
MNLSADPLHVCAVIQVTKAPFIIGETLCQADLQRLRLHARLLQCTSIERLPGRLCSPRGLRAPGVLWDSNQHRGLPYSSFEPGKLSGCCGGEAAPLRLSTVLVPLEQVRPRAGCQQQPIQLLGSPGSMLAPPRPPGCS